MWGSLCGSLESLGHLGLSPWLPHPSPHPAVPPDTSIPQPHPLHHPKLRLLQNGPAPGSSSLLGHSPASPAAPWTCGDLATDPLLYFHPWSSAFTSLPTQLDLVCRSSHSAKCLCSLDLSASERDPTAYLFSKLTPKQLNRPQANGLHCKLTYVLTSPGPPLSAWG